MGEPPRSTPWVLLRGLVREARHWGELPVMLGAHQPGTRVITPDLPGNGRLCRQESPLSIAAMVDHCRQGLVADGHAPPYRLLALSMGGMVATDWAARYPDEIERLVLVNTSMRPYSRFHHRLRPANYTRLLKIAAAGRDVTRREALILLMVSNHEERRRTALPYWADLARDTPVTTRNALRQLFAAARFQAPAAPPRAATLILASERDGLVDVACSRALARAWRAELALHPDAGHDLALDDPGWILAQLAAPCTTTRDPTPMP